MAASDSSMSEKVAALARELAVDHIALTMEIGARAKNDSPALTGNPTAPTPASGDNSQSIATTAFVEAAVSESAAVADGVYAAFSAFASANGL